MFTKGFQKKIYTHFFINNTCYVGLLVDGSEVNASEYERQEITFEDPTDDGVKNDEEIRFPIAESDWGTIDGLAIYDSETGGDKMDEVDVTGRKVDENEQPLIPAGGYELEMTSCD